MFKKVLIANRGEIAVRVIRTLKRLGIASAVVYSDADRRSLHVQYADEAVCIGPAPARESYLNIDKVIQAALFAGCEAVHPGYGFLSENAGFADAVSAAGLTFIGPPAGAIAMMGDKIAAKELAVSAGVPVIPGYDRAIKDLDEALAAAAGIGYPVLLKPAAGGGGKGMRIVSGPGEMEAALSVSRKEAGKSFGESTVFLERYIEKPRHVEIQILADAHGHIVHLGERECSIQRRYQKVIEESPSPAVSEALRRRMGEAARSLAKKAGYINAGTLEFILDAGGDFYFLEMNTRLQVEHPVTELVNGIDLVEMQVRIASGEALPFKQEEVRMQGWAMEARICAEDPARGFMPSTGMVTRYAEPRGKKIRVDSGVDTGSHISIYYDSMMAKVICHGQDREEARTALIEALNGYHIEGFATNVDFVNSVLCHPEFAQGHLHTGFIDAHFDGSTPKRRPEPEHLNLMALAATLIYHVRNVAVRESLRPMVSRIGRQKDRGQIHSYRVRSLDDAFRIELNGSLEDRHWEITVNEKTYLVKTPEFQFYRRRLALEIDGQIHRFRLRAEQSFFFASFNGITRLFEMYNPREWDLIRYMPKRSEKIADDALVCPMPGLVVDVRAAKGDRVFRGQTLVVLESMKMESGVASPIDGVIAEILVEAGQAVEAQQVMIRFQKNGPA